MQNFLLMVENHYKTSAISTNSTMSLIKLRLDILYLLSTSQKRIKPIRRLAERLNPPDFMNSPPPLTPPAGGKRGADLLFVKDSQKQMHCFFTIKSLPE